MAAKLWLCSYICGFLLVGARISVSGSSQRLANLFSIRGGSMDDIESPSVGKDRELFHASIDLKWLFDKVSDKTTWVALFDSAMERVKRFHLGYEAEHQYRLSATKAAEDIRDLEPGTFSLRVFQNSLHEAQHVALLKNKCILFYCEEEIVDMIPSLETFLFRKALCDHHLGRYINNQFVFMAAYRHHSYAKYVVDIIGSNSSASTRAPFLAVLSPKSATNIHSKNRLDLKVEAVFHMPEKIVDGKSPIIDFLQQVTRHLGEDHHETLTEQDEKDLEDEVSLDVWGDSYVTPIPSQPSESPIPPRNTVP